MFSLLSALTTPIKWAQPGPKTMVKSPRQATPSLADLRREIDRIDADMHALLIERGEIIDRLIAVKKTE
jgi:Chorismate mutase type II